MWFAYIDESKDQEKFYIYTALITSGDRWASTFEKVKAFRQSLRREHGVYLAYELHAWKFAPGRGRPAKRAIYKPERAEIFEKTLKFVAECNSFVVVSSCSANQQYALERLLNRLNKTAARLNQQALLFFDDGEEAETTKLIRRMRVYNPIRSNRGVWADTGSATKSIPLTNILEDPIFKDSKASHIIQLADFCAYALLQMERPRTSLWAGPYRNMYEHLRPVSRPFINPDDPRGMGIIRDKAR